VGNLTYEIGSTKLRRERGNGLDLSLRHTTNRVRAELNYFHYRMRDFVFLAPSGEREGRLPVAEYHKRTRATPASMAGSQAGCIATSG
jgi:hypothetical protein